MQEEFNTNNTAVRKSSWNTGALATHCFGSTYPEITVLVFQFLWKGPKLFFFYSPTDYFYQSWTPQDQPRFHPLQLTQFKEMLHSVFLILIRPSSWYRSVVGFLGFVGRGLPRGLEKKETTAATERFWNVQPAPREGCSSWSWPWRANSGNTRPVCLNPRMYLTDQL